MSDLGPGLNDPGETRSLGAIVGDISADLSALVRQEMELARTELKQEARRVGKGAGMLGGAGIAGLLTLLFLSLALVYLLDNWMPTELSALIVGLLWAVVAAVLAMRGRKEIQEADPQLPQTQQSLKEDVQWAKEQKN
ncbi:phage holin family protein [Nocardioides jishulii]|uniref:Phage holin family protein n=1 Tax=Nocardioides jishulii TaxID=2575440 RepID=A0A4U2YPV6_9ACTN|nr:phage holin family protein [Nocardioides jishulii]QCX27898.1 phage holin family protein [Nocardioides jishulii]TKI62705.1 phage holin family protein [Nocardioides jishulii]